MKILFFISLLIFLCVHICVDACVCALVRVSHGGEWLDNNVSSFLPPCESQGLNTDH